MNEAKIQSYRTCIDAEEYDNANDHDRRHDLDLNPTDGENGLIKSTNEFNSGEHSSAKFPVDDSGGCSQGFNHSTSSEHVNVNAHLLHNHSEGLEIEKPQLVDFSSSSIPTKAVLGPVCVNPRSAATKGFGLKKWRRIKREITKDGATNPDSIKILKRGSPNLDVKPPNDGDGSVASTNAFVHNLFAADTVFTAGLDSDNSDDRSSKSSTAASAPKYRHDTLRLVGHQREKHRVKNLGRNSSTVGIGPRSQAGKVLADSSKKHRGQSLKLDKENPFSCVESDLRSCNSVLHGGTSSGISDQAQSGRSINFDGEDAYDDQTFDEQSSVEELRADCSNNGSLSQDNPSIAKNGNGKNYRLPGDCDPLVNSIQMLQSAQVVLEREVQKFGEMGKGIRFLCDDSNERDRLSDGCDSEFNHVYLNKNDQTLETQLSEAEGRLKEKDMKIAELEATIKHMKSCRNDKESTIELQHKRCQEMEVKLDGLLEQKFEAEIEYVVITRSTKELSVLVEDQIKLLREQKYLVRERTQSLRTLTDVENEDVMLRGKAEQLDALHQVTEGGANIPKMQRRVVNSAKCFLIQLILLVLVFGLLVLRLIPKSTMVVPT